MEKKHIKKCLLTYYGLLFAIAGLLTANPSDSFAGIESDVVPQVYNIDDFEDAISSTNYPHYYPTGGLGSDVVDPDNSLNKIRQLTWDSSLPDQWWYSDTWDGLNDSTILDATYYSHLVFKVRGAIGEENFRVELQDSDNVRQGDATYFVEDVTPEWQEIWIPISYFAGDGTPTNPGINLKKTKAIAFTFYDIPGQPTGTVCIDDVRFVGCVIDDFNDVLPGSNTLRESTYTGGAGITENSDLTEGSNGIHKIAWYYPGSGDKPFWYTATEFASPYAGFNPIYYNYLYFRIKGLSGGEEFKINYHTPSTYVGVSSKDYFTVTTDWQDVYIPLKSFTDQNVTRNELDAIAFKFAETGCTQAGTIYIDDVELKYVKHDPIIATGDKNFYKDYKRGFHIKAYDVDGDPLTYSAENLPAGAKIYDGFILWKPGATGTYPVTLIAKEDRAGATEVRKSILIKVLPNDTLFVKPQSTGTVRLNGRELIVSGTPFKIKGVGYQPLPIGSEPGSAIDPLCFERDFPILVGMGCNTIRTWGDPGDAMVDAAQNYGLKVCAGYWVDYGLDPSDPTVRANLKSGFRAFVNRLRNKPAILLWAIGNENNYHALQNKKEWCSLVNEMAQQAYDEEGAAYHPVAIVNGNFHNIGDMDMYADDALLPYLDIWGANVYPGYSFGGSFDTFAELSDKALWISEYGVDAYHTTAWHYEDLNVVVDSGYVDEEAQAEWNANSTVELLASDIAVGGTIMAYSDEWWKAGNPSTHDPGGFPQDTAYEWPLVPDSFMNEEYWGIVSISPDGSDPDTLDDVTPREAYYKLKEVFRNMPFSVVKFGESVKAVVEDPASEAIIYVEKDVYDEGLITLKGKSLISVAGAPNTVINGRFLCDEAGGKIDGFEIVYSDGGCINYVSPEYPEGLMIMNDAGVTIINANYDVKNCIIRPDLESMSPVPTHYGNGIQIWNLYARAHIAPNIENNLIRNADVGIFTFSQAFGGEIWGYVQNNTLDNNLCGIVERMHKENPLIRNNVITNAQDGVHITYANTTPSLLDARVNNIITNNFYSNSAMNSIWCDELQIPITPVPGNIYINPLYNENYEATAPECASMGWRLP